MSYILDALRRADAERRSAQTPALQQVAQGSGWTAPATPRASRRGLVLLAGLAGAVVTAGVGWLLLGVRGTPPTPAAAAVPTAAVNPVRTPVLPTTPSATPTPAPVPAPVPTPEPAPAAAPPKQAPLPTRSGAPVPAPSIAERQPASPPRPSTAAPRTPAVPVPELPAATPPPSPTTARAPGAMSPRPADPAQSAGPPAEAPSPSPPAARPVALQTLPEAQRSAIAALGFGGAVQSQDRAQSFVMQGSQIVREGQVVAPGITVERIEARALVLRLGEQLVRVPL